MPFPNFHAARIRQPGLFVEGQIRQLDDPEGGAIRIIGGRLKSDPQGSAVVQAIRFEKGKFSASEARAWLKDHDFKTIEFEEATKEDAADEVTRFDHTSAGKVERTDEGFMIADAVVTRAGVFKYRMADGSVRSEFRSPDQVFHHDSMKTAEMLPVTNDHPYSAPGGRVTAENAKELAIGYTGERVRQDGMSLRAPVKITTQEGIKAIEGGRRQLSLGYRCRVAREDGVWEGEKFTHKQMRIRYNHLALVDAARAGKQATLRLDGADAVMVRPAKRKESRKMGDMVTVKLDSGIPYECAAEVAVEVEKLRTDRSELQSKLDSASKATEELQGKHDALEAKVKELEARDDAAEIAKAVKARLALVQAATPRLPKDVVEKLDGMSDDDIRKAVILAKAPKAELDEKTPEYIGAYFDAICAEPEEKRDDGQGRKIVGTGKPVRKEADSEQARADSIERAKRRSLGLEPEEKKSA
ncbi:MAG: DUF2213 domain-containing protein [Planctomycetota bacterium]|jgi:hypothetical protein